MINLMKMNALGKMISSNREFTDILARHFSNWKCHLKIFRMSF